MSFRNPSPSKGQVRIFLAPATKHASERLGVFFFRSLVFFSFFFIPFPFQLPCRSSTLWNGYVITPQSAFSPSFGTIYYSDGSTKLRGRRSPLREILFVPELASKLQFKRILCSTGEGMCHSYTDTMVPCRTLRHSGKSIISLQLGEFPRLISFRLAVDGFSIYLSGFYGTLPINLRLSSVTRRRWYNAINIYGGGRGTSIN